MALGGLRNLKITSYILTHVKGFGDPTYFTVGSPGVGSLGGEHCIHQSTKRAVRVDRPAGNWPYLTSERLSKGGKGEKSRESDTQH